MNRKDFIALVRKGKTGVRVDDIEISFKNEKIHGSGMLECEDESFSLKVRLPEDVKPPSLPTVNFLGKKDCGTVTGVIDHDLPFKVDGLFPSCSMTNINGRITVSYDSISFIELVPERWDNVPAEARLWILEQLELGQIEGEYFVEISGLPESESPATSVTISGLLLGYALIAKNAKTEIVETNDFLGKRSSSRLDTVHGKLSSEWNFALLEREDDVEFHLKLREGCTSTCEADDLKALSAFQTAIAFIHGQHAWPFTLEYWRDGRMIFDRVHRPRMTDRMPFRPFSERIWANARAGNDDWSFEDALSKAFSFFHGKSALSEEVAQLLFLVREAIGPTQGIVLCSLLESLVKAIFEGKIAPKAPNSTVQNGKKGRKSAANITEKFKQVIEYLKLPWAKDWEVFCEFWREHRNRLVHRATKGNNDDSCEDFLIESRVAGAINMLILKLMNYKGIVNSSIFEDKFKRI